MKIKELLLGFAVGAIILLSLAFVPSLTDFNNGQFGIGNNKVAIKSGAPVTNAFLWGNTTGTGGTFTAWSAFAIAGQTNNLWSLYSSNQTLLASMDSNITYSIFPGADNSETFTVGNAAGHSMTYLKSLSDWALTDETGTTKIEANTHFAATGGRLSVNTNIQAGAAFYVHGISKFNGAIMPLLSTSTRAAVIAADGTITNAAGTPDGTKFLRDDNTYVTPPGAQTPLTADVNASQKQITNIANLTIGQSANMMQFGFRSGITTMPIPFFRPLSSAVSLRFDLMPLGGAVDLVTQPIGFDICPSNVDVVANCGFGRVACDGSMTYIDSQIIGTGIFMPVGFKMNGNKCQEVLSNACVEYSNPIQTGGQAYWRFWNKDTSSSASFASILLSSHSASALRIERYDAASASYPNLSYFHDDSGGLLTGYDSSTGQYRIIAGGTSVANNTAVLITNKIMTLVVPLLLQTNTPALTGTGTTNFIIDCSLANVFNVFPTGNFKIWLTNATVGFQGWINIVQDGSGSRLWVYDSSNIKTNASLVLSTPANSVDRIDMRSDTKGTNVQFTLSKAFQ